MMFKWKRILVIVAVLVIGLIGFAAYGNYRMSKIPYMTFDDMLAYTLKGNEEATIAIGIIQNGKRTYQFHGNQREFEIGSLTKTFTASMILQSVDDLEAPLNEFTDLPEGSYPTIRALLTHTSGYKGWYFEEDMIWNFLNGRNDYYGISTEELLDRVAHINWHNKNYGFRYSNFGYAVLGEVLSQIHGQDFTSLLNDYVESLGLHQTFVSDGSGPNYWEWQPDDAYLAAGGLVSTLPDMLSYAQIQLSKEHEILEFIDVQEKLGIRMDAIGAAWLHDLERNMVWHNGATGHYNSYLGFDVENQIAVVILSDLSPNYRIPATLMGLRLLEELR